MKKNLAEAIQNLICALDETWYETDLFCEIYPLYPELKSDEWRVVVASRDNRTYHLVDVCALATAMDVLANHINYRLDYFDIGTSESVMRLSVLMS